MLIAENKTAKLRIGQRLVSAGLITEANVKETLAYQKMNGGKFVEDLIILGHITPLKFREYLAKQPGTVSLELLNYEFNRELVSLVPKEFALKNEVFPIDKLGKYLTVAMAFPLDIQTIQELESICGMKVKAFLSSPGDIHASIGLYYPKDAEVAEAPEAVSAKVLDQIESSVKLESVAGMVRQVDTLPALPETVQKVRNALSDASVSIRDIGEIVQKDPPLSAKLLQVVNSAAFGFSSRIDSVDRAVALLGLGEVSMIVTSAAVLDLFKQTGNFDYQAFWKYSEYCANASVLIARRGGAKKTAGAYTAGLLHDVGRLALAQVAPKQVGMVSGTQHSRKSVEEENKALGISHPEAGFLLAQMWNLPDDLCEPIRYHHAPENAKEFKELVATVQVATTLFSARQLPDAGIMAVFDEAAASLEMLGLDQASLLELRAEAGSGD